MKLVQASRPRGLLLVDFLSNGFLCPEQACIVPVAYVPKKVHAANEAASAAQGDQLWTPGTSLSLLSRPSHITFKNLSGPNFKTELLQSKKRRLV